MLTEQNVVGASGPLMLSEQSEAAASKSQPNIFALTSLTRFVQTIGNHQPLLHPQTEGAAPQQN